MFFKKGLNDQEKNEGGGGAVRTYYVEEREGSGGAYYVEKVFFSCATVIPTQLLGASRIEAENLRR